jgi:hypothetical protein
MRQKGTPVMSIPAHFVRDLERIDQIAARPDALVTDGDWQGFNPAVVSEAELSFISGVYQQGYANGWLS